MSRKSRLWWSGAGVAFAAAALIWWRWDSLQAPPLAPEDAAFVAQFSAPPAADSAQTRRELDQLLALQGKRTEAELAAARADRKTELRRFYGAIGLDADHPPRLPHVEKLAERVEDDVRIHVRMVKDHFRRLRPYEIEPRLQPCFTDVQGDLSYPSGHAAFGYSMAYLLSEMVPERRAALETRAAEFARQRMVCSVHFPSDLEAGRLAAQSRLAAMKTSPEFLAELTVAAAELRAALRLPPR